MASVISGRTYSGSNNKEVSLPEVGEMMGKFLCKLGFHDWGSWSKAKGKFFERICCRCHLIEYHVFPPPNSEVFFEYDNKFHTIK